MANSPNNIVQYFRNFFIPPKTQRGTNALVGTKLYPFSIGSALNIFPTVDTQAAVSEGFTGNATVYSIARDTGEKFGSIPRYLIKDNLTTSQKVKRNRMQLKGINAPYDQDVNMNNKSIQALANLLNKPNEYQGQDAFYSNLMQSKTITGEAFIWLNRGYQVDKNFNYVDPQGNLLSDAQMDAMPVLEMYWMPSNYMTLLPDPNDPFGILGWVLIYFGYQVYLRTNDIILWKNTSLLFDPVTRPHLRGMSPLRPGGAILQQNTAAVLAATRTFQNNGARGLLFADYESPESLAPGTMDAARSVIESKLNSGDAGGAIATLLGKWAYLDLAKSQNMPLMDGQRYTDQQLCMLFQMPYEMIQPGTTFANKEMASKNWVNNTIIPSAKQLDDEMNRVLLKAFALKGIVCISSDFTCMYELQEDRADLTTSLMNSNWLTLNEKRIIQGFDPLADPNANELILTQGEIPSSQLTDEFNQMNQPITNDYNPSNPDDTNK